MTFKSKSTLEVENKQLRKLLAEVLEPGVFGYQDRSGIVAPEDPAVKIICERYGYGAVMDSASRRRIRSNQHGGLMATKLRDLEGYNQRRIGMVVKKKKRIRMGLSREEKGRIHAKLMRSVPSAPWADNSFYTIEDRTPDDTLIVVEVYDPTVFPPAAECTPMRRCKACTRYTPRNYINARGVCYDCYCDGLSEHKKLMTILPSSDFNAVMNLKRRLDGVPLR